MSRRRVKEKKNARMRRWGRCFGSPLKLDGRQTSETVATGVLQAARMLPLLLLLLLGRLTLSLLWLTVHFASLLQHSHSFSPRRFESWSSLASSPTPLLFLFPQLCAKVRMPRWQVAAVATVVSWLQASHIATADRLPSAITSTTTTATILLTAKPYYG